MWVFLCLRDFAGPRKSGCAALTAPHFNRMQVRGNQTSNLDARAMRAETSARSRGFVRETMLS